MSTAEPDPLAPGGVPPLTLRTKDGTLYTRPVPVEAQLAELVLLSPQAIIARVRATSDYRHPAYVRNESLAYFLREWQRTGQTQAITDLVPLVIGRVDRQTRSYFMRFAAELRDDAVARVYDTLWGQLFMLDSPRGEFWQVAFGLGIERRALSVVEQLQAESRRAIRAARDTTGDDPDGTDPFAAVPDTAPSAERRTLDRETLGEALAQVPEPQREAYVLHYGYGWHIEGNTPPTLDAHFGKTGRTIRNWLRDAEGRIERWKETEYVHAC